MTRPLLGLSMIVKDCASTIRATLETVRPHIDCWLIMDTGSIDGTQEIVRETLRSVPGKLIEEPIVVSEITGVIDFAATRNKALDVLVKEEPVFVFSLSADEYLRDAEGLRDFIQRHPDVDAFNFQGRFGQRSFYNYPHVFRSDWRFNGEFHELPYPSVGEIDFTRVVNISKAWIESDTGSAPFRIGVLRDRDAPALEKLLAVPQPEWLRARYLEHLAQTYEVLAEGAANVPSGERPSLHAAAAAAWRRRVEVSGDVGATRRAAERYLDCVWALGLYRPDEMQARLRSLPGEMTSTAARMIAACEEAAR